jgi:hypothetical protein
MIQRASIRNGSLRSGKPLIRKSAYGQSSGKLASAEDAGLDARCQTRAP